VASNSGSSTNLGAIVGGAVGGGVVVAAIIVGSVIFCLRRRRSQPASSSAYNSKSEATQTAQLAMVHHFPSQNTMTPPPVQTPAYNPFQPAQNQYPVAATPVDAMSTSGYASSISGASTHPSVSPLIVQGGYTRSSGALPPGGIVEYP